ncbi:hypothetical protein JTE90_003333 [Oedothorax gibbosus]|uniref:THAP-type domain-containing protein n=1 Tax=Oedothorax gibbosus TaxID=931172 RepID=A0AAV6UEV3_9ARAC|nr:hypothetical protein JTE90_003333 [Oedothorax gibbosus]
MDSSITLHNFPQDPRQSVKWIQEINSAYKKPDNAPQWFPKANSVICSKHFQATDFSNDVLKPKAVPTIFINRTDQPTCAKQAAEVSKVAPAVIPKPQEEATIAQSKPDEDIKDILARGSDLFNKNMAIAKSLEDPMPAPDELSKENEDAGLPELNLDMSLADLQSKLTTPAKAQADIQKDNESTPINGKLASTPKEKTQVSGKRKLEEEPQFDFIKIGENKYLKIQRAPPSENASTSNANKSGGKPDELLVNMLTKNCSAVEKQNVIDALTKYNMSQPVTINSTSNTTATVPKMVTSNSEGKLEITPQSQFIKIGDGKYLKISRLPTDANKPLTSTPITPSTIIIKKAPIRGAKGNVFSTPSGITTPKNNNFKQKAKNINSKPSAKKINPRGKNNSPNKKRSKKSDSDSEEDISSGSDESSDEDLPTLEELTDVSNKNVTVSDSNLFQSIDEIIDQVAKSGPGSVSNEQPEANNSINESPTTSLNLDTPKMMSTKKKKYKRSYFKFGTMPAFRLSLEEENGLLKSKIKELEKRSVMPINQQTALERENIILKREVEKLKKEASQAPKDNIYKKLKAITEESGKGDASAAYILDQINCFQAKMPKFSNSTYLHCALLCRKNTQAYELFRKAELFRLPAFNTVDRFMRRHPDMNLTGKTNPGDIKHGIDPNNMSQNKDPNKPNLVQLNKSPKRAPVQVLTNSQRAGAPHGFPRHNELEMSTVEVDTSNSELREVVLETGEVVQCYASDICMGEDGHQYFIMRDDHSNSHSHHSMTHSQDVYVPNAAGQLQYTETEVAIATGMIS